MPTLRRTLGALAAIGTVGALRLEWWYWPGSLFLRAKSDVWVALAWNFAHGEFYRPVAGPAGYGATRYMPLLFVVHGMLIRAGMDPIRSGIVLMHASVAVAAAALFLALRSAGVPTKLALALTPTVWCTLIFQQSCTDLNPDYLAAAMALAAAAIAFASGARTTARIAGAAFLCALATLTKVSAALAVAPIAFGLWTAGRRSDSRRLVLGAVAIGALGAAIVQIASNGYFFEDVRGTLFAGMTVSEAWRGVPKLLWELSIKPFDLAMPVCAAVWCAWRDVSRSRYLWQTIYLAATMLAAVVILAAPGTASNHLVDLQLAATVVVASSIVRGEFPVRLAAAGYGAIAASLAVIAWPVMQLPSVIGDIQKGGRPSRAAALAVHDEFGGAGSTYLSLDPIVPILHNERPVVVDYFFLERAYRDGTGSGRDFEARVRAHSVSAIVVRAGWPCSGEVMNAGDPAFDRCADEFWSRQDSPLTPLLRSASRVRAVRKPFVVLQPSP